MAIESFYFLGCHSRTAIRKFDSVVCKAARQRDQAERRIDQLDEALKVLGNLDGLRGRLGAFRRPARPGESMSPTAYKRTAAAQRPLGEMESSHK